MKNFFVTGTDTDVGKTFVTRLLLAKAKQMNFSALAIKPVACGGVQTFDGFKNEDAIFMQAENSIVLPYEAVNPFLLQSPLSPHIAAKLEATHLDADEIVRTIMQAYQYSVDYLFFEGAGGWQVPINDTQTMADIAKKLAIPVIVVVAMRLGCLNHALLTVENILSKNLPIAGFIANQTQKIPQEALAENIATLANKIPAPLLGVIPYADNSERSELTDLIQLPTCLTATLTV